MTSILTCDWLQWLSEAVVSGRGERQAELDRENAHFHLAETVISTFEEVGCARSLYGPGEEDPEAVEDEDDEEIRRLQREIRRRRGERRLRLAQRQQRQNSDGGTGEY